MSWIGSAMSRGCFYTRLLSQCIDQRSSSAFSRRLAPPAFTDWQLAFTPAEPRIRQCCEIKQSLLSSFVFQCYSTALDRCRHRFRIERMETFAFDSSSLLSIGFNDAYQCIRPYKKSIIYFLSIIRSFKRMQRRNAEKKRTICTQSIDTEMFCPGLRS